MLEVIVPLHVVVAPLVGPVTVPRPALVLAVSREENDPAKTKFVAEVS